MNVTTAALEDYLTTAPNAPPSMPAGMPVGGGDCPKCDDCAKVALQIGLGLGIPLFLLLSFNLFCFCRQWRRRRAASQMKPLFPVNGREDLEQPRKIPTDPPFPMTKATRDAKIDPLPVVPEGIKDAPTPDNQRKMNQYVIPPSSPQEEPPHGYDYPDQPQEAPGAEDDDGYLGTDKQEDGGHINKGYLEPDSQAGPNDAPPVHRDSRGNASYYDGDDPPPPLHDAPSKAPSSGYVNSQVQVDPAIMKMQTSQELIEQLKDKPVPVPPTEPPPEDQHDYYNEKRTPSTKSHRVSELDQEVAVPSGLEPEPVYVNSTTDLAVDPSSAYMTMSGTKPLPQNGVAPVADEPQQFYANL